MPEAASMRLSMVVNPPTDRHLPTTEHSEDRVKRWQLPAKPPSRRHGIHGQTDSRGVGRDRDRSAVTTAAEMALNPHGSHRRRTGDSHGGHFHVPRSRVRIFNVPWRIHSACVAEGPVPLGIFTCMLSNSYVISAFRPVSRS